MKLEQIRSNSELQKTQRSARRRERPAGRARGPRAAVAGRGARGGASKVAHGAAAGGGAGSDGGEEESG